MDSDSYRALMRHQAGAVAVIAAGTVPNRTGLTATAVCSLTDSPPTILVCVNKTASAHDPIREAGCFSVNLLSRDHADIAGVFSGKGGIKGEDRFGSPDWDVLETGAPILMNALAALDCELQERIEVTTHSVFIGRVADGVFNERAAPLLYYRGDFWDLAEQA